MQRLTGATRRWLVALSIVSSFWIGSSRLNAAPPAADPANWMQDISDQIGGVSMRGIAIPGTHDSAMYYFMADNDYAKTQDGDFNAQLTAGARWLDFRYIYLNNTTCSKATTGSETLLLTPHTGWYMFGHGGYCTNVQVGAALQQVTNFLQAHPQEIITISSSTIGVPVKNPAAVTAFQQSIAQILTNSSTGQSYIYNDQTACTLGGAEWQPNNTCDDPSAVVAPQNVTPKQLWSTSARVILLHDNPLLRVPILGSWVESDVEEQAGDYDPTGGTSNPSIELQWLEIGTPDGKPGLYQRHPAYASWTADPKMQYLSAEMTPFGSGPFTQGGQSENAFGYFFFTPPFGAAATFDQILTGVIQNNIDGFDKNIFLAGLGPTQENWMPYSINVVELDYVNYAPNKTPQAVIAINDQQWPLLDPGPNGISELAYGGGVTYKLEVSQLPGNDPELDMWSDASQSWSQVALVGFEVQTGHRVAVDPNGQPWVVSSAGQISRQISTGNWSPVGGLLASDIAIGSQGSVWAIGSADSLVYSYNPATATWIQQPGVTATRIAVDNTGMPWVITSAGTISHFAGRWNTVSAPFTPSTIAIGRGNTVWALGPNVWEYQNSSWTEYRNAGVALSVDYTNAPWVATGQGGLFKGKFRGNLPDPLTLQITESACSNSSGTVQCTLTVKNNTQTTLSGPFILLPIALTPGVQLANFFAYHGFPGVSLSMESLESGQSTVLTLSFTSINPNQPLSGTSVYFHPLVFPANM